MGEMVTTCPHCHTTFRVTSEQLNIHEGDVRCGRCAAVFNAFDSLSTQEKLRPEAETKALETAPAPEPVPESAPETTTQEIHATLESLGLEGEPLEQITYSGIPEPGEGAAAVQSLEDIASTAPIIIPATGMEWEAPVEPEEATLTDEDALPALKKKRRWPWGAGMVVLLLTLLAQPVLFRYDLAYFGGDNFKNNGFGIQGATSQFLTDLGVEMVLLCNSLGCPGRHDLLKFSDNISIDSSELQADPARPTVVILNAILRSHARFQQDYPVLELTLTDTDDHATARRTFTPAEYLPNKPDAADIRRGMKAGSEIAIKLFLDTRDLKAVGYRLYVFYP